MNKYIDADDLSFSLTLHSPMTKEDWEKIEDLEMESVPAVTFTTPSGKDVEYVKAVRCADCRHRVGVYCYLNDRFGIITSDDDFCSWAERRKSE